MEAFDGGELDSLRMSSDKKKALIDFLSCLPDIIAKAQSESNIRVGFYENGMIDGDKSMYPVM
eukprot:scaffold29782_cov53-Cyclotella_meneghiniana.AAC.1